MQVGSGSRPPPPCSSPLCAQLADVVPLGLSACLPACLQLLVAVNKLDAAEPPWEQARFETIKAQLQPFLELAGFKPDKIRYESHGEAGRQAGALPPRRLADVPWLAGWLCCSAAGGLGVRGGCCRYVPVSGLTGENVVRRTAGGPLDAWYRCGIIGLLHWLAGRPG